jgi:pimeloyl-ACP methyl ester carboxylesterase
VKPPPVAVLFVLLACRAAPIPEGARYPAGTAFTARFLSVAGTRIRYIDAGTGLPVVFLHGLGASVYAWRKTLEPVAQAGFRVIAFDNRGFGESDKPPTGYGNADYERLVVALLDSLRLQTAVLVGHSMGGAIAGEVAIRDPQRVRGLVLIGAAGVGIREPLIFRVARWPLLGPLMVSFRSRGLVERLLKSTYADPGKVTPADVDQYYAPVADPRYGRALRAVLREFDFKALEGRLDSVQVATLLIWGERDRWVPAGLGRQFAAQLLRAAFLIVPHAGHSVQEEAPSETNRLLIRFLTQGLPRVPEDLARSADGLYVSSTVWLKTPHLGT